MFKAIVLILNIMFLSSCVVNVQEEESQGFEISNLEYTPDNVASYELKYFPSQTALSFELKSDDLILVKLSRIEYLPKNTSRTIEDEISLTSVDDDFQDIRNLLEADFTFNLEFHKGPRAAICDIPIFSSNIKDANGSIILISQSLSESYANKYKNQEGYITHSFTNSASPNGNPLEHHSVKKYLEIANQLK